MQQIFNATAALSGQQTLFDCLIAGHNVRLNFASHTLVSGFTAALAHRQIPDQVSTDLEISIWDENSASAPMPAPPWSWDGIMVRREIGGYDSNAFRIWFDPDSGVLSILDLANNSALVWVKDARRLPAYEIAAPFRMIFHGWLRLRAKHFVHAAAVGTPKGGVLLAGAGGSGKSTTSLLCLASCLSFISDDYCAFSTDPMPYAHGIYCSAKLNPSMLESLPLLLPTVYQANIPGENKSLLLLQKCFSRQLLQELPIKALLLPKVGSGPKTAIYQVSALDGIRALAPSTLQQIAGPDESAWRAMTALAKKVPSYRLELGSDLKMIPKVIVQLLEQIP